MMKRNNRAAVRIAALIVVLAVVVAGCSKQGTTGSQSGTAAKPGSAQGGRRQSIIPVQATIVQSGLLTSERNTAGVVSTVMQSQVATQVAGVVKSLLHLSGEWVKAGDTVVQLDDAQLSLSLANAQK